MMIQTYYTTDAQKSWIYGGRVTLADDPIYDAVKAKMKHGKCKDADLRKIVKKFGGTIDQLKAYCNRKKVGMFREED